MKAVAVLVWDLPDDLDPTEWHKGIRHSADILTTPVGCGEPDVRLPTQAFLGINDVARDVLAVFARDASQDESVAASDVAERPIIPSAQTAAPASSETPLRKGP